MIDYSLELLEHELAAVSGEHEYVIFGSTVLALRGIIDREPGDVDVIVTRRVWGALLGRDGWRCDTPNAGDPPILSFDCPNELHLFFAWRDVAVELHPAYLLETAETVLGFRVATVREVLRHKRAAYACRDVFPLVEKHAPDIAACERWLGETREAA